VNSGDVKVMGLVVPAHLIEDIRVSVGRGVTVTIPADQAARSKDLWRGISQKCLFQLTSTGHHTASGPAPTIVTNTVDTSGLQNRLQALEERNATLEEESRLLRQTMTETAGQQQQTLDTILAAVQAGGGSVQHIYHGGSGPGVPREELADGSAPQFIPDEIKPTDAETRIDTVSEESESGVSSVAERLRKLRQKQ